MSDLSKLRELVAQSCRVLGKLNLTKEPSGHVSARVPGEDRVLIKARGPEESGLRFVERARHHHRRLSTAKKSRATTAWKRPRKFSSIPGSIKPAPTCTASCMCIH